MAPRRPGKKIGEKHVIIDGGARGYDAELRYSQDTKRFYAYYKDECVEGETEGELAPLLKALVAKHELLTFELFIDIEIGGYVHEGRRGGTGTGGKQLAPDDGLYQLNVEYRLWAVAVNELEAGAKRIHIKAAWVDAKDEIRTADRIEDVYREDMANWVKYTPERLAVLDQVRRGMVELHNKLAGIFGEGESAAKFLDAPRGLLLLGKGGGK